MDPDVTKNIKAIVDRPTFFVSSGHISVPIIAMHQKCINSFAVFELFEF